MVALKSKQHVHKNTPFVALKWFLATIAFQVGMKSENLAFADVWIHKIMLTHRAMFPFALEDRYDPNKASKHQQWVCASCKKFFRTIQTQASRLQNPAYSPLVVEHIKEVRAEEQKKYNVTREKHFRRQIHNQRSTGNKSKDITH